MPTPEGTGANSVRVRQPLNPQVYFNMYIFHFYLIDLDL